MSAVNDQGQTDFAERQITSGTNLILRGDQAALAGPLFAINWFDARPAWVYHLYNLLAGSRLSKAGGRAIFKAKVVKTIGGDETLARRFLLIVRYPTAEIFLNLASDRVFLVMSVLRMISVKKFSFVMHRRLDEQQSTQDLPCVAVVHFSANDIDRANESLATSIAESPLQIGFSGQLAVTAATQDKGGENKIPYVTDNTVLLMAESNSQLEDYFSNDGFQQFVSHTDRHYAGLLRPVLRAEDE